MVDKKVWNIALSVAMLASAGCGTATVKEGPQVNRPAATAPLRNPESTSTPGTDFSETKCNNGVSIQMPKGWFLLQEATGSINNCYVSKTPIANANELVTGFHALSFAVPNQIQNDYAQQLLQPSTERMPIDPLKKERVGTSTTLTRTFNKIGGNRLFAEEETVVLIDRDPKIYRLIFSTPKPNQADDFQKFGRKILDTVKINGKPIK